jgi:hypothetical protein
MTKLKRTKMNIVVSPERLADLRRGTLIASAGTTARFVGSKLSDKEVEQVANIIFWQK